MAGVSVTDGSGNPAAEGTTLMAELEPVDPDTYSGADPIVGVGQVDGNGDALLTPWLAGYMNDPDFDGLPRASPCLGCPTAGSRGRRQQRAMSASDSFSQHGANGH